MEPLVSVIIPVYNVEKYLNQCIESVLTQKYSNLEVLLIDDGSTDMSAEICDYYCTVDSRVRCFHKPNGGAGSARNVGIKKAKGEYIYFLDSDDYIDETLFSSVIPFMSENNLDICFFSATVILEDGLTWNKNRCIKKIKYEPKSGKELFIELINNNEYNASNCLLITKKRLIADNSLFVPEGIYYEDNYFLFQLLMAAGSAAVLNESYYFRRVRFNSTMTQKANFQNKISSALKVIEQFNSDHEQNDEIVKCKKSISLDFCNIALIYANQSKDKRLIKEVIECCNQYHCFNSFRLHIMKILFLNLKLDYDKLRNIKKKICGTCKVSDGMSGDGVK